MKILLLSFAYAPSLGGIETVSQLVADGLEERGHEVRIITMSRGTSADEHRVTRRPGTKQLLSALRSSDAVVQSNVSLGLAWPLLLRLVRRRWVVVNHTPIARPDGRRSVRDWVKLSTLPRNSYSVSSFLAEATGPRKTRIMPNPYDDSIFRDLGGARFPPRHLLFVGRLAPVKGLDILLKALAELRDGISEDWRLTVVGSGPSELRYRHLATQLDLDSCVTFLGRRSGRDLAQTLNAHQIVVMPSRTTPPEAFPLVPMEAAACGCTVVGSNVGGLPESIGVAGEVFPAGDSAAMISTLRKVVESIEAGATRAETVQNVSRHTVTAVAQHYEQAITDGYLNRHQPRARRSGAKSNHRVV